ncbi:uncharacterized protein HGUI_03001 [Hanseniaspora guilliermondii]|uniref:Geranylgeranyl pyrophosphate synthase n=1 Tax=Hanseniaspora guilliermondii TaxID=56406 RepID=A0A1L0CQM7_9ASCO|nr:uncharacterized protein HGUI_03001 [Hanseniaspora guilliermondii]
MDLGNINLVEKIDQYLLNNENIYETISSQDVSDIRLPLSNLNNGKGFRQLLLLSLATYMDLNIEPQSKEIVAIMEFINILHNSSLLIDDIEDNSLERRGEKCAYIQYGTALTLNCGTYGIFEAIDRLVEYMDSEEQSTVFTGNKKYNILKKLNNEIMYLHIGQGLEIFWRDISLKVPDFLEYLKMIRLKTSGMLRILAVLFLEFFEVNDEQKKKNVMKLMEYIGVLYQIRDDYLNIIADNSTDIHEGKFSFPILIAINKELNDHEGKSVVYNIVTKKHKLDKDIEIVMESLKKYDVLNITVDVINNLIDQIIVSFDLTKGSALVYLLQKIRIGN